jgi:cbb3-type cytochrome c oxidase subunit III
MIFSKTTLALTVIASSTFTLLTTSFFSSADTKYAPLPVKINQQNTLQQSIANGKEVYADFCMQCHQATGKGSGSSFPPLDGSDWLKNKRTESIRAVKYGQKGPIVVNGKKFNSMMPAMGLSDEEVADVMNYVMNSWSNKQTKMVTVSEVALIKK